MPIVDIDGIATHDEISGSGPPILMMAPGGFDSAQTPTPDHLRDRILSFFAAHASAAVHAG